MMSIPQITHMAINGFRKKTPMTLGFPCQFPAEPFQRLKTGNGFPAGRLRKSASKALISVGYPTQKGCFFAPKSVFFPQFSRTAGNSDAAPFTAGAPRAAMSQAAAEA